MKILEDLVDLSILTRCERHPSGFFHTGVLRDCGLAATLLRDALKQEGPLVKEPGSAG
jgi:hypothetical protein